MEEKELIIRELRKKRSEIYEILGKYRNNYGRKGVFSSGNNGCSEEKVCT